MDSILSSSWARRLPLALASVVAFATAVPTTSLAQTIQTIEGLGFFPPPRFRFDDQQSNQSVALGVNADGTVVVGYSVDIVTRRPQAVRWTAETGMVGLDVLPGGNQVQAFGVNADGTVVVGSVPNGPAFQQAVRWTETTGMVGLGFFAAGPGSVNADATVVVGFTMDAGGNSHAIRWTEATGMMVDLGVLPGGIQEAIAVGVNADGTVVVGIALDGNFLQQAFRWTAATGMVSLGDSRFTPTGVNADGTVVVGDIDAESGRPQAFRWTAPFPGGGGFVGLGFLPGANGCHAAGVNADGTVVVGSCRDAVTSRLRAFRWTAATGMVGLDLLPGPDITFQNAASAVSADGTVVVGYSSGGFILVDSGPAPAPQEAVRWTVFTPVSIMVKPPAAPPVSIKLGSAGVIPVAILSTPIFDASQVDPASVELSGATVRLKGKSGQYSCNSQDVDGDGLPDLVCHVTTASLQLQTGSTLAVLTGKTFSGSRIKGEQAISIMP